MAPCFPPRRTTRPWPSARPHKRSPTPPSTSRSPSRSRWGGDPFTLTYAYGPQHQRTDCQITATGGGGYAESRHYFGELERQEIGGGNPNWILYVQGGDGLCAMIVNEGGVQTTYSVYKDHLGNLVALTKKVGSTVTVEAQQNFDAWGRKRNATNWTYTGIAAVPQWLYRGYTGHEHVEPFALINMNGRMYDPLNGRMLSADNYIHEALGTQGYNRFSYAFNNPLKYTDPSGESLAIPFFAMGMLADGISNLINGVSNPLGQAYSNVSASMSGLGNCLKIHTQIDDNTMTSVGFDPFTLGFGVGFSRQAGDLSYGFGFGVGMGGSYMGMNASYAIGDFSVGASAGVGPDGSTRAGGGLGYQGASIGVTRFGLKDPQWNWQVGYQRGDFSFRMTNDAWLGSDWYRSAAAEVGVGAYAFGFNLYTTKPPQSEFDRLEGDNKTYRSMWDSFLRRRPSVHKPGTYSSGERVYAGMYFGYSDGMTVSRIGIDAPFVQDFFQNGVHHFITTRSPYFNTALGPTARPFWQVLGYNPWTLY